MGNFESRVKSIVHDDYGKLLDLFQSTEDRTGDLGPKLDRLIKALPLLQDIKTEVASCEKLLHKQDQDEDKKEDKRNKPRGREPSQEKLEDLREFIKDLLEADNDVDLLPDFLPMVIPEGDTYNFNFDFDPDQNLLWKFMKMLWSGVRRWENEIAEALADREVAAKLETIRSNLFNTMKFVTNIETYLRETINTKIDEIKDNLSDLSRALEDCCEDEAEKLSNLQNDMTHIKRAIDTMTPQADQNRELTVLNKTRSILSELQTIRGLL